MLNTPWEIVNTIVNTAVSGGLMMLFFWLIGSLIWDLFASPYRKQKADHYEQQANAAHEERVEALSKVRELEWRLRDAQGQLDYAEDNLAFQRNWISANLPDEIQAELTRDWCAWSEARSRRRSRETTFGPYLQTYQGDDEENEDGAPAQAVPA